MQWTPCISFKYLVDKWHWCDDVLNLLVSSLLPEDSYVVFKREYLRKMLLGYRPLVYFWAGYVTKFTPFRLLTFQTGDIAATKNIVRDRDGRVWYHQDLIDHVLEFLMGPPGLEPPPGGIIFPYSWWKSFFTVMH